MFHTFQVLFSASEQLLYLATIIMGIFLVFQSEGNNMRIVWGALVLLQATISFVINLDTFVDNPANFQSIVNYESRFTPSFMCMWFFITILFSLFPIISLKANWFTLCKTLFLFIPLLIVGGITIFFSVFSIDIIPIFSFEQLFDNLEYIEVRTCLFVLVITIITPLVYVLIPFLGRKENQLRQLTLGAYLYLFCFMLSIFCYFLSIFFYNSLINFATAFVSSTLPLCFSIFYLYHENPFSIPPTQTVYKQFTSIISGASNKEAIAYGEECTTQNRQNGLFELSAQLSALMEDEMPYKNEDFTMSDLVEMLQSNRSKVNQAIAHLGFTGFREYISFLRVQRFKNLAAENKQASVQELMYQCGYSSRATFYRQFATFEQCTPKEYIERMA